MYHVNELKKVYDRLHTQYPRYDLTFSGDRLTMTRLHSKVEVDQEGAALFVNGTLYDRFSSEDVDDPDDLYELIESFLLDLQHIGMTQGNETYLTAQKKASQLGSRFLIAVSVIVTVCMIALLMTRSLWWALPLFAGPALSLVPLALIRKTVLRKYWVCPACGQSLPLAGNPLSPRWTMCPNVPTADGCWSSRRSWNRSTRRPASPNSRWGRPTTCPPRAKNGPACWPAASLPPLRSSCFR